MHCRHCLFWMENPRCAGTGVCTIDPTPVERPLRRTLADGGCKRGRRRIRYLEVLAVKLGHVESREEFVARVRREVRREGRRRVRQKVFLQSIAAGRQPEVCDDPRDAEAGLAARVRCAVRLHGRIGTQEIADLCAAAVKKVRETLSQERQKRRLGRDEKGLYYVIEG